MPTDWVHSITDSAAIASVCDAVAPGQRATAIGAWGSSSHIVGGAIAKRTKRPVLMVVAHLDDADEAAEDLAWFDGLDVTVFPALEIMPGETNISLELLADRLQMVSRLAGEDAPDVIVAPIQALMQAVPGRESIGELSRTLRIGDTADPAALAAWLDDAGYNRVDAIEEIGDYALRGGIVDVYPPGNTPAVRLDFFGDTLDEISEIDLESMGSGRKLKDARLIGATSDAVLEMDGTVGFWTLLPDDCVVVLCETLEINEQARGYYTRLEAPTGIYPPQSVAKHLDKLAVVEINQYAAAGLDAARRIDLPVRPLRNFEQDSAKAIAELVELATGEDGEEHDVTVLCGNDAEAERLGQLLGESKERVVSKVGYLYRGFVWEGIAKSQAPIAVVPHHELFHRYHTRRRIRRVGASRAIETFLDLEVGDYVVHTHHGVARFKGLRTMQREGVDPEEYLTLEFAEKAKLHVPASQIELVNKYVGGFAGRPPLSKLGGKRWSKQKEQVAEAVEALAKELLRVQAARASMPGHSYGDDTVWMQQFEAEFPYQATDDQLAAIAEIKRDMRNTQPMDRLICGDVGYGKTELAIRAAFKAVEGGKQVAVLCPTTVLCEQHERTFRERMADYPVRIEALNRFKHAPDMRLSLEGIANGTVDICIGTHRLLSDDVTFRDLGMVVVDEEQKFGVEHKSKLMRFRVTVDMLTMSATPIPRTLNMALLGLRDISSLSTPPADRRAVVTEVSPYDEPRIRRAIVRELNRGGQCFFVHNRVQSIHTVAAELRALVPEAKMVVGHGQMTGRELEEVMLQFIRGEADVLVCTTIIESGIDIPTANTMFIADADRFGLAELHQLRGRVGRYKHRAYCYLMLPKDRPLSEVATRRLNAIEEFSMLGAGFKIAMRDMEIRGAGNILGPEQSGHIAAVGYQLYCKLLEEATASLKHETLHTPVDVHLELGISGQLPRTFIPSDKHRMEAYRRINRAGSRDELAQVDRDLTEAYGELPRAAQRLMALAEIRLALCELGAAGLKLDGPDLIFTIMDPRTLNPALTEAKGSVRLVDEPTDTKPGTVFWRPPGNYVDDAGTLLAVLRRVLVDAPVGSG